MLASGLGPHRRVLPALTAVAVVVGLASCATNGAASTGSGRHHLTEPQLGRLSEVPVSDGPGVSSTAVTVLRPEPATNAAIVAAFEAYTSIGTCEAVIAPHTEHEARINATGELIAVAGFEPATNCTRLYGVPAVDAGPFSPRGPAEYILQVRGGQWSVVITPACRSRVHRCRGSPPTCRHRC